MSCVCSRSAELVSGIRLHERPSNATAGASNGNGNEASGEGVKGDQQSPGESQDREGEDGSTEAQAIPGREPDAPERHGGARLPQGKQLRCDLRDAGGCERETDQFRGPQARGAV